MEKITKSIHFCGLLASFLFKLIKNTSGNTSHKRRYGNSHYYEKI